MILVFYNIVGDARMGMSLSVNCIVHLAEPAYIFRSTSPAKFIFKRRWRLLLAIGSVYSLSLPLLYLSSYSSRVITSVMST